MLLIRGSRDFPDCLVLEMDKNSIADIFRDVGVLLELKGENAFKIRAYQSGARALESLEEELSVLIAEDRLTDVKGIGKALADKIYILHGEGVLPFYEELRASVPDGLINMLEIAGLGAKKIRALYEALGVDSIEKLEKACREGRVASIAGFGAKSEEKILIGIRNREVYSKRHIWWDAFEVAQSILEGLRKLPAVKRAEHAGSLRRGLETVGDLDLIVASADPLPIMNWFIRQKTVAEVTAIGETKSSVRLHGGLQADLRIVPEVQFCYALHHFTGSKEHNVLLRQRALRQGYSLSEWGITSKSEEDGERGCGFDAAPESEKEVFEFFGLDYIPPELREGTSEIEEAGKNPLPNLIRNEDLKGVFHNHTTDSDGHNTLEEMVEMAERIGWGYIGIADHSKASFQANGMNEGRLANQVESIRELNRSGKYRIHVYTGVECDILPDGELDFDDDILKELDYVVVSVHSSFSQSREAMTSRIIKAIEHPSATMLGHITGRVLSRREGYRVDQGKVIDAAAANGKIIELNANPHRLDMDWRLWRKAAEKGVLCAINPDAHSADGLCYYRAGVTAARKGWLTADNVLNTWTRKRVSEYLKLG